MGVNDVKRIETIYLPVSNPKRSSEWYIKHLGLNLLSPVENNATQAQLGLQSGQSLFLIQTKEKINANYIEIAGNEQCILTLEVNNFHNLYKKLENSSAHITPIQDYGECGENFYLYDLDQNKLDIWSGWPRNSQMFDHE